MKPAKNILPKEKYNLKNASLKLELPPIHRNNNANKSNKFNTDQNMNQKSFEFDTDQTTGSIYLEYINLIGNPSMVEKYLSKTIRLNPIEKKPAERRIGTTDLRELNVEDSHKKNRNPSKRVDNQILNVKNRKNIKAQFC